MTAAHKTLPFGTIVRVTNLENGKTIEVTINDRGPYVEGYVLDLSKVAFQMLGRLSTGVLSVEYEIVYPTE
ncbi:MAG: Rare lipoprotein A [uncultured bacterium]|nr:MAG: Rare lipoprotein A [uncultured bacterium]